MVWTPTKVADGRSQLGPASRHHVSPALPLRWHAPRRFPVQRLCSEQIYVNFLILSMDETLLWLNGVNYIGFSLGMDMRENICLSSEALLQ